MNQPDAIVRSTALVDVDRHFWLARSVARSCGINLSEALADGRLDHEDYALMVARCCAADCHKRCEQWLASRTGASSDVPRHCAIASILHQLSLPEHSKKGVT